MNRKIPSNFTFQIFIRKIVFFLFEFCTFYDKFRRFYDAFVFINILNRKFTHLKLKMASLETLSPSFVHLMRRNRLSLTATRSVARSDISISLSRTSNAEIGGKRVGGGVGDGGVSMCRCNSENFDSTVLVAFFVMKFVAT